MEILHRVQAAFGAQGVHHVLRDGAFVESFGAVLGNGAQGVGEVFLHETVPGFRRFAVRQEGVRAGFAQFAFQRFPVPGDFRMHRPAFGRKADGRLQKFVQALRAMRGQQGFPGVHRAGHGDGMGGGVFERRNSLTFKPVDIRRGGGLAGAVDGDDFAGAGGGIQAKTIAADAGGLRLDHPQHRHGGDGGVQRIAAGAQHIQRRQGGGGHGGGGHAGGGVDRAAAGHLEVAHGGLPPVSAISCFAWAGRVGNLPRHA